MKSFAAIAPLSAVLLVASLAGCSSDTATPAPSPTVTSEAPIVIAPEALPGEVTRTVYEDGAAKSQPGSPVEAGLVYVIKAQCSSVESTDVLAYSVTIGDAKGAEATLPCDGNYVLQPLDPQPTPGDTVSVEFGTPTNGVQNAYAIIQPSQ